MTLLERYEAALTELGYSDDPAQRALVTRLESLRIALQEREHRDVEEESGFLGSFFKRLRTTSPETIKGLYIYGGVGRGKTWLMDMFFAAIDFDNKRRVHFHRFMQSIHHELRSLKSEQNPLTVVADRIAANTRVLCFDEFYVSDIADAMLLAGLFERLFAKGVVLVATSNTNADDLYKGGLQRARFLPAIELIKQNTEIIAFADGDDYRLRALEKNNVYHTPADDNAERALARSFTELTGGQPVKDSEIELNARQLPVRAVSDNVVWFDFDTLCRGPRASDDYIELARCFKTVIVSDVPQFTVVDEDAARRFINMVDEFYDRGTNLLLSAGAPAEDLYSAKKLIGPFERTSSRLIEMQSHDYLAHNKP